MAQQTAVMQLINFILVERRQEDGSIKFHAHEDFSRFLQMEKEQMKSIELPSDEEIDETAWIKTTGEMRQYGYDIRKSFSIGAKWMKEQILNQNK